MYYTNEELDQYVSQIKIDHKEYLKNVVPNIIASLIKNPNNYLAFGVYWYPIKKVIQAYSTGDDWFYGDFHDQLIMEMADHGSDFRNIVAGLVYANETDWFSSSSHTYTWKGDPKVYILEDDDFLFPQDIEIATESVRSSGGLKALESKLEKKHNVKIDIFQSKAGVEFAKLIVPEEERDKGIGSKVMKEVIAYADKNGLVIGLTPSKDFGGTLGRLKTFYKRFGFVDNRGRNKDYSFRTTMIRNPKGGVATETTQIDFNAALGKPIAVLTEQIEALDKGSKVIYKDSKYRMDKEKDDFWPEIKNYNLGWITLNDPEYKQIQYSYDGPSKDKDHDISIDFDMDKGIWSSRLTLGWDYGHDEAGSHSGTIKDFSSSNVAGIVNRETKRLISELPADWKKQYKEKPAVSLHTGTVDPEDQKRVDKERADYLAAQIKSETEHKPIKIEGKLNQGLKDYFTENGFPEIGAEFENRGRIITLKEVTPRGDVFDVKMGFMKDGVEKEFPLTDIKPTVEAGVVATESVSDSDFDDAMSIFPEIKGMEGLKLEHTNGN